MGGFKAWIIKVIITELFDELGEPLIRAGVNQVGYIYDKIDGKVQIKKIHKAREDNDADAYNRHIDNVLS